MTRLRPILGTLVSLLLFAGTAEALVRGFRPEPRAPLFHLPDVHVRWVDGQPVWDVPGHRIPHAEPCPAEGGLVVVALSDSVLTSSAPPEQTVGPRLEASLSEALGRPVCVVVAGQPGMLLSAQLARAKEVAETRPVDAVVVAAWRGTQRFGVAEPYLFYTDRLAVTDTGLPAPPIPLPDAIHRPLLGASAAWRYLTLAVAREIEVPREARLLGFDPVFDWARALDAPLLLASMPGFARPLGDQGGDHLNLPGLKARTEAAGARWLDVGAALDDAGYTRDDVAADAVCHYTPAGHAAVAEVLTPPLVELLADPAPSPP